MAGNTRHRTHFNRREMLRIGGLCALGVGLPSLATASDKGGLFGRAKSCIILFLGGGPPQHETFDPKPNAQAAYRGSFGPIATSADGIQFCELLPLAARWAHRMTIIRSMTTGTNFHAVSGYQMMTGHVHPAGRDVPASPKDWPHIGGVVANLKPSEQSPLSSVTLPEPIVNNPGILWPGQDGGFMGRTWNPTLFNCDPSAPDFRLDSLSLPDGMSVDRLSGRMGLMRELDQQVRRAEKGDAIDGLNNSQQRAFDLLTAGATRQAFELEREPAAVRARYGRHKFGQSTLLARRLVEAGVRLVQVNFPREPGDLSSPNPLWDTHRNNDDRLKNNLCPPFDHAFAALMQDLEERGLLAETLVAVFGEFGRTPKFNRFGGRDHWGACFSIALAGAGIEGGRVIGTSDRDGAYPVERPVRAAELSATMFHLLGIDPAGMFHDRLNRPLPIADAAPMREIVG